MVTRRKFSREFKAEAVKLVKDRGMSGVTADQGGTPSLLAPIQAFRWFIDYCGRPGSGWINRVTRVLPATPVPERSSACR